LSCQLDCFPMNEAIKKFRSTLRLHSARMLMKGTNPGEYDRELYKKRNQVERLFR
jgi:hypothetical protein